MEVFSVIVGIVVLIALLAMGYGLFTATLIYLAIIATLDVLRRRLSLRTRSGDRNGQARQTHRIQESIKLWQPPEVVWDLIHPPENSPLLSPNITKGYRVPGTPPGRGEQQAFIDLSGITTVIEIIDYLEARRAVVRYLTPQPAIDTRLTYTLEPVADGCILTYGQEYEARPDQSLTPASAQQWRQHAQDFLERVRTTVATWKPAVHDEAGP